MAQLHSQMSALVFPSGSSSTDFSPRFVPRKFEASYTRFPSCPPGRVVSHRVRSPAFSSLASSHLQTGPCTVFHGFALSLSQGDTSNTMTSFYRERGEIEKQIQVDPSVAEKWAKGTVRRRAGAKLLTKALCSRSSYKKEQGKRKWKSIIHHSYKQEKSNPFVSHSVLFWVHTIGWYCAHI